MEVKHVIDNFLADYKGRDNSIVTRCHYWSGTLGQIELHELTDEQIEAALTALVKRGSATKPGQRLTTASINRYQSALGSVIRYAKENRRECDIPKGWHSPLTDIKTAKESPGRLEFYTADQIEKLVAKARFSPWKKLSCLILMGFTTGLRRGALLGLRWKDVDWVAQTAMIERTKSGKPHVAVLTDRVIAELRRFGPRDPDTLVFSGKFDHKPHDYRASYEVALKRAELPRVCFHSATRHSCASHLARNGANLIQIADTLTHSNLNTTRRYSHLMVSDRADMINRHFAQSGSGL